MVEVTAGRWTKGSSTFGATVTDIPVTVMAMSMIIPAQVIYIKQEKNKTEIKN